MLRHEITLNPRVWTAASKSVKGLAGRWPTDAWQVLQHPDGVTARFRVALTPRLVEFAGEIREPRGWDASEGTVHPEWYFRDHVVFLLDPAHDHATRRMVAVLRSGEVRTEDGWHLQGEEASDVIRCVLRN